MKSSTSRYKCVASIFTIVTVVIVLWSYQSMSRAAGDFTTKSGWLNPELEYLKSIISADARVVGENPQILFLLMSQYSSAKKQKEGIEFISDLLKKFDGRISDNEKAQYIAVIGLLRAENAANVSIIKRYGWVKETIRILEEAKRLSGNNSYTVRWISGVVNAQLPGLFGRKDDALKDLIWCAENSGKAPDQGWLREVYYRLAVYKRDEGNKAKAQEYLNMSRYNSFDKPIILTTTWAENNETGHTFSSKKIYEVIKGKIYVLSGYEFTEYYFFVSDDGQELIAIDAGTRPDSAKSAYEALMTYAPGLPKLTTVLITHSHWDHVGGHKFFRSLNPDIKFYARANYHEELSKSVKAPETFYKNFFGARFNIDDVRSFKPDITIDKRKTVVTGGTRIEFIPVEGGETDDALLVYLPDHGALFAGDFIMPFAGAPFVEEGNVQGLLDAINIIGQVNPKYILHGHEPLNRIFNSSSMLQNMKAHLENLHEQVLIMIRSGKDRATTQQSNIIPPTLLNGDPRTYIPYLVLRENIINRIYDQNIGYWQSDLQGLDFLGNNDRGSILLDYFDISEQKLIETLKQMITDGKYEYAANVIQATEHRFNSKSYTEVKRLTYLKLMEKYQQFNPFKFIIYSGVIGEQTLPVF